MNEITQKALRVPLTPPASQMFFFFFLNDEAVRQELHQEVS